MQIEEVSDILGLAPFKPPKYVLITDERLHSQTFFQHFFNQRTEAYYRGLSPKGVADIIILGADADMSTPFHEGWHSWCGLGELSAWPVGNWLARQYERLSQFPRLKGALSRGVRYREIDSAPEFPGLSKYRGRARLYVLTEG